MKKFIKACKIVVALFLLWMLGHFTYTCMDGLTDEGKKADLAIILGNKINTDGSLSERLKKRLECGLTLYKTGRVKKYLLAADWEKKVFMKEVK